MFLLAIQFLSGCAACGDFRAGLVNVPPTAEISVPADGTLVAAGDTITFEGIVGDPEDPPQTLQIQWISDQDGTLSSEPADSAGRTSFSTHTLSAAHHTISLQVTDRRGTTTVASIALLVNSPPTASVSGPAEGSRFDRGATVTLVGVVTDGEDVATDLLVSWTSDLDGVLGESSPDRDGNVRLETNTLSWGEHTVTMAVKDTADTRDTDQVTFTINGLPTVDILAPAADAILFSDEAIELVGWSSDPEEDPSLLSLEWFSDGDGALGTVAADSSGESHLLLSGADLETGLGYSLTEGKHLLTFSAVDSLGGTASATVTVTVQPANEPPSQPQISLEPAEPGPEDVIKVVIDVPSVDPENGVVDYGYAWYQNGSLRPDLTGAIVDADQTDPEDEWTVLVTARDSYDAADPVSARVQVRAVLPPTTPEIVLKPAEPTTSEGLSLTFSRGSVDQNPESYSVSYAVLWKRNDEVVPELEGTYSVEANWTAKGQQWTVEVTPSTAYDVVGVPAQESVTILNALPVLEGASIVPAEGTMETVFTAAPGAVTDADEDEVSFGYSWTKNGQEISTASVLDQSGCKPGENCLFSKGDTIELTIIPSDGEASGAAVVGSSILVMNSPPTLEAVALAPTSATKESLLLATPTGYADADDDPSQPYAYVWYRDKYDDDSSDFIEIENAASSTLSGSAFAHFDRIKVMATAYDGEEYGEASTSQVVTIQNSPPTATAAVISPNTPTSVDTLGCRVDGYFDVDGDDPGEHQYQWFVSVNDQTSTAQGASLASSAVVRDAEIYCVVTVTDGWDVGEPVTSDTVTIQNGAPFSPDVTIVPGVPRPGEVVACEYVPAAPADPDFDSVTYTFAWYLEGVLVEDYVEATLPEGITATDQTWRCVVTPRDSQDAEGAPGDAYAFIQNDPPYAPTVSISPQPPRPEQPLTCSYEPALPPDPDDDGVTYSFAWLVDGVVLEAFTDATISEGVTATGEVWTCLVTPTDHYGAVGEAGSASSAIYNQPPNAPSVSITPENPRPTDALLCSITAAEPEDPDGDGVSYQYVWYREGVIVPGFIEPTLPANSGEGHDVWTCEVTPMDEFNLVGTPGSAEVTFLPFLELFPIGAISGEAYNDSAGYAIAPLGDANGDGLADFAVGAPHYDADISGILLADAGRVYLIFGREEGWENYNNMGQAEASINGTVAEEQAGQALAGGDFNGDGLGDLVIGAPRYSASVTGQGRIAFIFGTSSGWKAGQAITASSQVLLGDDADARLGNPLAGVGDINGDGLDDVAVGTYSDGEIYLIFGKTSGWKGEHGISSKSDASFVVESYGEGSGMSVASAGDVDGDGIGDLLIGASSSAGGAGRAYLILGRTDGWGSSVSLSTADYAFDGQTAGDFAGGGLAGKTIGLTPLAAAGDVDGDGLGDFLVGASGNDAGVTDGGRAYLFLGASQVDWGPQNDLVDADAIYTGDVVSGFVGQVLAGAGDLDGDGYGEYLIAAPFFDAQVAGEDRLEAGGVALWAGAPASELYSLPWSYAWDVLVGEAGEYYGGSMAAAGDVNGDGRPDLVIGAPRSSVDETGSGRVYLYSGP